MENIFETSEFTHTKSGEQIPSVKMKGFVRREDYEKLNEVAKNHDGYYSKFSSSFLFKNADSRDAFISEATDIAKNFKPAEKTPYIPQGQRWAQKELQASERILKLSDELNKNYPDKLLKIFKDGLKVHCPHGAVE